MQDEESLLTLRLAGLGRPIIRDLLARAGSASAILRAAPAQLAQWLERRPRGQEALTSGRAQAAARRELRRVEQHGYLLLAAGPCPYPPLLKATADPPCLLWLRGDPQALCHSPAVAVVGSRHAGREGLRVARLLGRGLADAGVMVASGLARGIDAEAHKGALEAGGPTVAVLGAALDVIYPHNHRRLASRVAEAGALVSEHPLGTGPRPYHFPERNRILAGLVDAVVVVEAAARSGALITAHLAVDEGRDVLAVPGTPWDPRHAGTNRLIQEGAGLVQDLVDVLDAVGVGPRTAQSRAQPHPELSAEERQILMSLSPTRPAGVEEIATSTGLEIRQILVALSTLELKESILAVAGRGYLSLAPEGLMA